MLTPIIPLDEFNTHRYTVNAIATAETCLTRVKATLDAGNNPDGTFFDLCDAYEALQGELERRQVGKAKAHCPKCKGTFPHVMVGWHRETPCDICDAGNDHTCRCRPVR